MIRSQLGYREAVPAPKDLILLNLERYIPPTPYGNNRPKNERRRYLEGLNGEKAADPRPVAYFRLRDRDRSRRRHFCLDKCVANLLKKIGLLHPTAFVYQFIGGYMKEITNILHCSLFPGLGLFIQKIYYVAHILMDGPRVKKSNNISRWSLS